MSIPETDAQKRARYQARIKAHEAAVEVVRRSFDIDALIANTNQVLEVEVPDIAYLRACQRLGTLATAGALSEDEFEAEVAQLTPVYHVIRYKPITNQDLLELNKVPIEERGLHTLHRFLSRADPAVTLEKVRAMDPLLTARISAAIAEQTPLFLG